MNKPEAISALNALKQRLLDMDVVIDDGRDEYDGRQNAAFSGCLATLNHIRGDLSLISVDGIPEDTLNTLWRESGVGDAHLPESKYNHAMNYIVALMAIIS